MTSMSIKSGTITGDVVLHTLFIRACEIVVGHRHVRRLIYDGVKQVNVGGVETANREEMLATLVATTLSSSRLMRFLLDELMANC